MRTTLLILALSVATLPLALHAQTSTPTPVPAYVSAAMADSVRAADANNDARRQMAAVMTFTGVKPGDVVIELVPGSGYWTRVFSQVAGPSGHVYTIWPEQMMKHSAKSYARWTHLAATEHYANVSVMQEPAQALQVPAKADVVFTSQNYHDFHNLGIDVAKFDKAVFDAIKPGGVFIVIDHVAPAGSGTADTDTLHRIDPAAVKKELEAVGFVFDGASQVLHNADDPLNVPVFAKSIRGHTDQFIYRFRKPM